MATGEFPINEDERTVTWWAVRGNGHDRLKVWQPADITDPSADEPDGWSYCPPIVVDGPRDADGKWLPLGWSSD